ncbi:MAG TPA: tetratricopeptide repeat protein [Nitrososphaeraceae archaeon]|nr:tetratricopeptide repeat protein [Nitrososphaeraceae archaeon]
MQDRFSHELDLPLMEEGNSPIPLAIAVIMQYWGENIINSEKYIVPNKSINIIDGIELAEKKHYSSYIYKSTLKDIKKRIDQGIPPIVIFPGLHHLTQHALLITGYDENEKRITSYVPQPDTKGSIPESKFTSEWIQEDNIVIIIVPDDMGTLFSKSDADSTKAFKLCFKAEKDFSNGGIELAIAKINQSIAMDKGNAFAWTLLGSCYSEINNPECINCFSESIKLNRNYYLAYKGLGNFYLKIKDYHKAEKYYSQAIDINPNRYGSIFKNRAVSRLQLNDKPKAKQDLLLYLEKTPNAKDKTQITEFLETL